jgi:hypothetical protein
MSMLELLAVVALPPMVNLANDKSHICRLGKAYIYLAHNRGYMRVIGLRTHPRLVSSVWYQGRCWFM